MCHSKANYATILLPTTFSICPQWLQQVRGNGGMCLYYTSLATISYLFLLQQELGWGQHSSWCNVLMILVRLVHLSHFPSLAGLIRPLWTFFFPLPGSIKTLPTCMEIKCMGLQSGRPCKTSLKTRALILQLWLKKFLLILSIHQFLHIPSF